MGAIITIPLKGDLFPVYSFKIELEGVVYIFKFVFNSWVHGTYLQISDATDNVLVSSIPVAMGVVLLRQFSYIPELPQGNLFLYNKSNFTDIPRPGGQVVLMYEESD